MSVPPEPALWRRLLAHGWHAWGQSLCHAGYRMTDRSFYESGVRAFGRATQLWPTFAAAYYRRGLIRGRELNDYSAAIDDLTRTIELRPDWPDPYLQRGLLYRFNSAPAAALTDLTCYLERGGDTYWRGEAERHIIQIQGELAE